MADDDADIADLQAWIRGFMLRHALRAAPPIHQHQVGQGQPAPQVTHGHGVPQNGPANQLPVLPTTIAATSTSTTTTPNTTGATRYTPLPDDTSDNYDRYTCDRCNQFFPRRDQLQLHKFNVHNLVEVPQAGPVTRPPRLFGITRTTHHHQTALSTLNGGGLSPSPCRYCRGRNLQCIVNPAVSCNCVECSLNGAGVLCGAAGVKYRPSR